MYCGWSTRIPSAHRNCPKLAKQDQSEINKLLPPSLPQKAVNFAKATWRFLLSGFELSTQDRIQERLKICKDCPLFIKNSDEPIEGVCGHKGCGCHINESKFLNKLSWKSEKCPDGKW